MYSFYTKGQRSLNLKHLKQGEGRESYKPKGRCSHPSIIIKLHMDDLKLLSKDKNNNHTK